MFLLIENPSQTHEPHIEKAGTVCAQLNVTTRVKEGKMNSAASLRCSLITQLSFISPLVFFSVIHTSTTEAGVITQIRHWSPLQYRSGGWSGSVIHEAKRAARQL